MALIEKNKFHVIIIGGGGLEKRSTTVSSGLVI